MRDMLLTSRNTILAIIAAVLLAFVIVGFAHADEGTGTVGFCERHNCGPGEGPAIECPDPAPCICLDVTCEATDCSKTTVRVYPAQCPTPPPVVFPEYLPCRTNNDGTRTCPRKRTPRRVFVPQPVTP